MRTELSQAFEGIGIRQDPRAVGMGAAWQAGEGPMLTARTPIDGSVLAEFPTASAAQVERAIQSAAAAFPAWRDTPAPVRGELVRRLGNAFREAQADLAALVTAEVGKIPAEAHGEVQEVIDGVHYEAFNTSGGLGTLADTLAGKVRELNYKTVRYLGHREHMKLLLDELRLCEHRQQLKEILERAVPVTFQDVVVTFCTVTGWRKGLLVQKSDARKIYHQQIGDEMWSAIQITTAAGVCAVLDLHVAGRLPPRGLVTQEDVPLEEFLANRFGQYYESRMATRYSSSVVGEEQ